MQLIGQPGAVLKCTGCTGVPVVSIVKPGANPYPLGNIRFENFILDGNGTAAEGLFVNQADRSEFNNIRVYNATTNGFHLTGNVLNTFTNPKVTDAEEQAGTIVTVTKMPATAMLIDGGSSANTIINPVFEGDEAGLSLTTITTTGFKLAGIAIQNVIIGGSVEKVATGIALCTDSGDVDCSKNTFIGTDLESNTANDLIVGKAYSNQFSNLIAVSTPATGKNVQITSSASSNQFIGGAYSSIFERGNHNTFVNVGISGVDAAHLDAWFVDGALINVRDLSGVSSIASRLPYNTQIGNFGGGIKSAYTVQKLVPTLWVPATVPGNVDLAVYVDSNITAAVSAGATVSVGYMDGILPSNFILSGYVDPANPGNVYIRWTQISGAPALPPAGNYKITVLQ